MVQALIAVAGWLAAAALAWWQLATSHKAVRVQRTIAFHEVLTTGEVGAARDRLATLMWYLGERSQPGRCLRPTFAQLLGTEYSRGTEAPDGFDLDVYPSEVVPDSTTKPLQDLYRLLWAFERVDADERHGLIEQALVKEMLDHHIVWWDTLASEISNTDTRHRVSLARLAADAKKRNPELGTWASSDFVDIA